MGFTLSDWLTVTQARPLFGGVSTQRVHQIVDSYGIETQRLNERLLLLKRADVERIARMERPTGQHIGATGRKKHRRKP